MNNSKGKKLAFVSMSGGVYFWDKLQTFRRYVITEDFFCFKVHAYYI